MSSVVEIARHLMAVMQPQTGSRSSGVATITASGDDVEIPRSTYALPIVQGQVRPELVFKVGEGPNADKSWTVTSTGTDVDILSNIGGARHNLADGTKLIFDPPIDGIASIATKGSLTGGADATFLGGVKDMIQYEQLGTSDPEVDLWHGAIQGFPAVIVTWSGSKDLDVDVRRGVSLSEEIYTISVIASRMEADHIRRLEGQIILDGLRSLLIDRQSVDGVPFSSPSGVQITRRGRQPGKGRVFQAFYIYFLEVVVSSAFVQTDTRTYHDLELISMDVLKPQDPVLPNQGDITVVDDNEIDLT